MEKKHLKRPELIPILLLSTAFPVSAWADDPITDPVAAPVADPVATPDAAPVIDPDAAPDVAPIGVPISAPIAAPVEDVELYTRLSLEDLLALPTWQVTTASKREEESGAAPATVFVITKEDIYLRGYSTLIDVLRDLPGIEISEFVYATIGTQVAVRGVLGNNKIILLVNGMRVNPPGGDPMMFRSDLSVREAEQIEIIYGPGSTLYGQDAISAVINVKTKRATGEKWIEIGAGEGYPWRYETWLGLNRKLGEVEINGYLQYSDATLTNREKEFPKEWETYKFYYATAPSGLEVLKNPKRWDKGLNAFMQFIHDGTSIQLWHRQSWRSSAEGRAGYLPFVEANQWSDVATVVEAKQILKLATDVTLSSAMTFNRFQLLPFSRFILPAGSTWVDDHKYALETSVTLEETISAKIGKRISLLGGFVYGHYDIMPTGTVPAGINTSADVSSQAGTIDYYTTPGDPTSKVSLNKMSNPVYQNLGFYAEGTIKLHDQVQVLLGMRLDKDTRYGEIPYSPRAALVVNATSDLTLKAIYTQAYVAPAPYNMYDVYKTYWINTVNLDLKPERARSYEINAVFRRKNILANVSVYYNIQDNLLLAGGVATDAKLVNSAVYPTADPDATSVELYHDANGGKNRAYGCDIFGRYSLASNRASMWGSYSYVDSEMTNLVGGVDQKTSLPGLAHHNFRLGGTVNILQDKLLATLALWLHSNPENVSIFTSTSPYTVKTTMKGESEWPYEVSLSVIYRLKRGFEAFATLNNLTNHHYATAYDSSVFPGELFRGLVGLRYGR
jgi:outer membrane receptor protein involved in Fe transport